MQFPNSNAAETLYLWLESFGSITQAAYAIVLFALGVYACARFLTNTCLNLKWRHKEFRVFGEIIIGLNLLLLFCFISSFFKDLSKTLHLSLAFIGVVYLVKDNIWKLAFIKSLTRKRTFGIIIIVIPIGLLTLGAALSLPASWDEMTYHIALPVRWASESFPVLFADNPYSGFPSAIEILFFQYIQFGGVLSPRLLVWLVCLMIFLCAYMLLKPGLAHWKVFILVYSIMLSPVLLMLYSQAYVEPFIVLNMLGAFILIKGLRRTSHGFLKCREMIAFAVLAGGALAIKLTGSLVTFVIFLLILDVELRRKKSLELRFKIAIPVFFLCLFFFSFPFYFRAYLGSGNPFHPYFASLFSSNPEALACSVYHHQITQLKYGIHSFAGFIWGPVLLAFKGRVYDGSFGWQLLLFILILFLGIYKSIKNSTSSKNIFLVALPILYLGWYFGAQQARFFLPIFFLGLIFLKSYIVQMGKNFKTVFFCALLISLIISVPVKWLKHFKLCWSAALGRVTRVDYLYSFTGPEYLRAMEQIIKKTPENSKIMLLFEHRSLYIPRKHIIGTPFFQSGLHFPIDNPELECMGLFEYLKNKEITHILVGLNLEDPDRLPESLDKSQPFVKALAHLSKSSHLNTIWKGRRYILFELSP